MRESTVYDLPSEEAIIASVLLQPDVIDEVMASVQPTEMSELNGAILRTMIDVVAGRPNANPSVQLVLPGLHSAHRSLEPPEGWAAYLAALYERPTPLWNLSEYCRNVRNAARRAQLKSVAARVHAIASDPMRSPDEIQDAIETEVALATDRHCEHHEVRIAEAVGRVLDRMGNEAEDSHAVPTGFDDLDPWLGGGLRPGQLVILAARPSIGKSAFATNVAVNAALSGGVAIASLEMSERELTERMIAAAGDVPLAAIQSPHRSSTHVAAIENAANELRQLPLVISDDSEAGPADVIALARRTKRRFGLRLVVVDYLQLMNVDQRTKGDSREREIATLTRRLKIAAKKLQVPILCLSQLSREAVKSPGPPQLHHLRESGAIEQDADVVLFLHRDDAPDDAGPGTLIATQVHIAKNRGGAKRYVNLMWHGSRTRFVNSIQTKPLSAFN